MVKTIFYPDGSSALEFPDTVNVTAHSYPKLNKNIGHEYVQGMVEKGKGFYNKTSVLHYEQNGYKYDGMTEKIIGTGKHIVEKK